MERGPELWWKKTVIEGQKVVLVPYMPEHVEIYHSWMQDEGLLEATGSEPLSLDEEYAMQQSWAVDPCKCTFILLDRELIRHDLSVGMPHTEAMAGDVNLYLNDPEDAHVGEIEIMIAEPKSRRKGLAKEALQLMMTFATMHLEISCFRAKIAESNNASLCLFHTLGYKDIGYSNVFKQVTLELTAPEAGKNEV